MDVYHPASYTVDHSLSGVQSHSDLEIAHVVYAISRLRTHVTQIPRLRGTYTTFSISKHSLFALSKQSYGHLFTARQPFEVWVTNFPTCTPKHYFSRTHLERGHREGLSTSASPCSSCSLCHLRLSAWCRLGSAISSGPISKVHMKNRITNFYTAYVYVECNGLYSAHDIIVGGV